MEVITPIQAADFGTFCTEASKFLATFDQEVEVTGNSTYAPTVPIMVSEGTGYKAYSSFPVTGVYARMGGVIYEVSGHVVRLLSEDPYIDLHDQTIILEFEIGEFGDCI